MIAQHCRADVVTDPAQLRALAFARCHWHITQQRKANPVQVAPAAGDGPGVLIEHPGAWTQPERFGDGFLQVVW